MITPELNARIVEIELHRTAPAQTRYRPHPQERGGAPIRTYGKYLRYALSALSAVAFGNIQFN